MSLLASSIAVAEVSDREQLETLREQLAAAEERAAELATANEVLALEMTRLADENKASAVLRERSAELDRANQALRKGIAGLGQLDNLSHFLGEMLKAAVATAGAHAGGVVLVDQDMQTYRVYPLLRAHGGLEPPDTKLTSSFPLSAGVKALFDDIGATSTAWMTVGIDVRMDPEFINYHLTEGNQTVAHIPMRAGDKLLGMLGLGFPTRDTQFEKDFPLLRSLADQMAMAVEMVRLSEEAKSAAVAREQEKAARDHAAELTRANEALRRGVDGLVKLDDLEFFLREMLKAAVETAGAQGGVVGLLENSDESYRFAVLLRRDGSFAPPDSPLLNPVRVFPALRRYLDQLLADAEGWSLPPEDPLHAEATRKFHAAEQNRALRHIPMVANGKLIGWLGLGFADPDPELGKAHSLLRVLADQMTMAVQMLRVSEEAKSAAVARERELAARARAAELARTNDQLALRDRLLTASAKALEQLISATDFSAGVIDALRQIGETAQLSRVQVLMEVSLSAGEQEQALAHELVHEWWAEGLVSQKAMGYLLFPNADYQEVVERLHKGERWWAKTEHWPSQVQPAFRKLGIVWTGVVPIFVQQRYVGLVAFDQCAPDRDWSEAEIDALTIAARGIGAALSQERMAAQLVREREQAAQDRASELVKANYALRSSVDDLVTQTTTDGILTSLLKQAIDISGASSGAILKRVAGSEFEYVTIYANGAIRNSQEILAAGTNAEMRAASRLDPTGHFGRLANGEAEWREVDDPNLTGHLPNSTAFHRKAGSKRIYDFPYKVAGQVFGYLGLAFADRHPPSETVQETIKALATQVGLALEFRRISEQVERSAVMEERNKFARDLHDTLAQGFAAILMQLGAAEQIGPLPVELQPYLTRIDELARTSLAEARRTVSELRTSERVRDPLLTRLSELARRLESAYGCPVQLAVKGRQRTLPFLVEDELYLIAQESVTNAMKHAQATEVKLEAEFNESGLRLKVKDDGKGFSSMERGKPDHFGLQTMQERSQRIDANLTIISEPGFGTEILTLWKDSSLE